MKRKEHNSDINLKCPKKEVRTRNDKISHATETTTKKKKKKKVAGIHWKLQLSLLLQHLFPVLVDLKPTKPFVPCKLKVKLLPSALVRITYTNISRQSCSQHCYKICDRCLKSKPFAWYYKESTYGYLTIK